MPLYEYECRRTGLRFETIQKFSDAPLTKCPECDEHPECPGEVRRLLSAPAIQFKGEGWYVTDYARKGKEDRDEKPKKNGDGGGDKADAKPAASPSEKSEKSEKKKD